ncbi:MAG: hypothetical protein WC854_13840, partial [Bacteroidales bacterium]
DGFLQILPHGKHPCHSLTLPVNPVCTGTYTLLVKELCPTYKNQRGQIAYAVSEARPRAL